MAAPARPLLERLLGRRRSFVVEWRYQLRSSLLPFIRVALLLVLFMVTIHLGNVEATRRLAQEAPSLRALLEAQDHAQLFLILCAAGVYLLSVLILGFIESHRTVGAMHHVEARLAALRQGDLNTPLVLRRGDNFQELGQTVNELLEHLRVGVEEDLAALDEAIERLEGAVSPGHPLGEVRRILSAVRARKQSLLDSAPTFSSEPLPSEHETAPVGLS
jgi:hypothetical protein